MLPLHQTALICVLLLTLVLLEESYLVNEFYMKAIAFSAFVFFLLFFHRYRYSVGNAALSLAQQCASSTESYLVGGNMYKISLAHIEAIFGVCE